MNNTKFSSEKEKKRSFLFSNQIIQLIFIDNCKSKYIIIPDVREEHELLSLKDYAIGNKYDFYVFRIERAGLNLNDAHSNDKTETDLDDYQGFSSIICNDSDIKHLYTVMYNILKHYKIIDKPFKEQLLF